MGTFGSVLVLCKTSSRPFRLCSFGASDFPFRGNFFGSFASWDFFFFFFPPFRRAGEEVEGLGVHLVFSRGASSPPARSRWSGWGGGASCFCLGRAARSLFSFYFGGGAEWELPARCRLSVPRFASSLSLNNSHRTFHDVGFWGRLRRLANAFYPPVFLVLRIVILGRIRGQGHVE